MASGHHIRQHRTPNSPFPALSIRTCLACIALFSLKVLCTSPPTSEFFSSILFLTQSSHALDLSFYILSQGSHTMSGDEKDRCLHRAGWQWPYLCPFSLTAPSQANTSCFPLSWEEKGMALALWRMITGLRCHHCSHQTTDLVAKSDP